MDKSVVKLLRKRGFRNVQQYESTTGAFMTSAMFRKILYIFSKINDKYTVTREDSYLLITKNVNIVLVLIDRIANRDEIVPNSKAREVQKLINIISRG